MIQYSSTVSKFIMPAPIKCLMLIAFKFGFVLTTSCEGWDNIVTEVIDSD